MSINVKQHLSFANVKYPLSGCLGCFGILALVAIILASGAVVITLVWGWVVPDVFEGAVEQGVLPASITFWQALKFSILLTVLGLTRRMSK